MTLYSDALSTQRRVAQDIINNPEFYARALLAWEQYMLKRESLPEHLAGVLRSIHHIVSTGDTYFMSSTIEQGLQVAASALPDDCQVHKESFPSPLGFLLLEQPLPPLLPEVTDIDSTLCAISWWYGNVPERGDVAVLVCWGHPSGGTLMPVLFLEMKDGDTVAKLLERATLSTLNDTIKFIVATFNFLEQQLLEPARTPLPRQQRRQAERTHPTSTNTVNVIRLRRRYTPTDNDHTNPPVSHDFQWMVRGHWRKQPYKSKGPDFYKHIFIQPYVKGPEDKPLKGTDRVYAIVR